MIFAAAAIARKDSSQPALRPAQQTIADIYQGVIEFRVDVQRLVGRDASKRGVQDNHLKLAWAARSNRMLREPFRVRTGEPTSMVGDCLSGIHFGFSQPGRASHSQNTSWTGSGP